MKRSVAFAVLAVACLLGAVRDAAAATCETRTDESNTTDSGGCCEQGQYATLEALAASYGVSVVRFAQGFDEPSAPSRPKCMASLEWVDDATRVWAAAPENFDACLERLRGFNSARGTLHSSLGQTAAGLYCGDFRRTHCALGDRWACDKPAPAAATGGRNDVAKVCLSARRVSLRRHNAAKRATLPIPPRCAKSVVS